MLFNKLGFSFLEMVIVMLLLTVLSAIAIPKFIQQREIALIESSAINLLSFLELGSSESIKRGVKLHVHYIPQTQFNDGCIAFNENNAIDTNLCISSDGYKTFKLANGQSFKIKSALQNEPKNLFYFSSNTGLPSIDLSILLDAKLGKGYESGVLIRRYKGLVGCSQTGILNWRLCN